MNRALVKLRILQDTLDWRGRLLEQVDAPLLKLRTRDRRVEVDAVYSWATSIDAFALDDRFRFARSHAMGRTQTARAFPLMSFMYFCLNLLMKCVTIRLSKSTPPRCVSPDAALTSKTPSSIVNSETSNVTSPRSTIRMFRSPCAPLSSPYGIAAAVGSLMIRMTLSRSG